MAFAANLKWEGKKESKMIFIFQVLKNRRAMRSAWELVKLIKSTTSDGELTAIERNSLNKAFWELANEIRKS